MNTEYKYTTDGKKVIVVGNLNSQEKIVQEIFIVNGNEIPSGENFVAKSLHDAPAVSWKETELQKLESRYEKDKKEWNSKIENLIRDKNKVYESLYARVKWLRNIAKEPRDEEFKKVINQIADFFSNTEKWVFVKGYSEWSLEKFNEDGVNTLFERHDNDYGRTRFDSIRLLSLFGSHDGSLLFKVNDYGDGSGSDKTVKFFRSKEEALIFIQKEFDNEEKYNDSLLKIAEKHNLKLDAEKLKAYVDGVSKNIDKDINTYTKSIENAIERKKELLKKIENHG